MYPYLFCIFDVIKNGMHDFTDYHLEMLLIFLMLLLFSSPVEFSAKSVTLTCSEFSHVVFTENDTFAASPHYF